MRIKKINKIKPWLIQIQLKAFLFGPMFFFFLFFPEPRLKTWKRKRRRRPIIGNKVHMGFFFFFSTCWQCLQEEEEDEEEGLCVCCSLSRINTLVEGTLSFTLLYFTFCLSWKFFLEEIVRARCGMRGWALWGATAFGAVSWLSFFLKLLLNTHCLQEEIQRNNIFSHPPRNWRLFPLVIYWGKCSFSPWRTSEPKPVNIET